MEDFVAKPRHLIPVLIVLAASTIAVVTLSNAFTISALTITPFTGSEGASILNALYFVAIIAVAGTLMYFAVKVNLLRSLKYFIAAVYALISFTLIEIYLFAGLRLLNVQVLGDSLLLLAVEVGFAVVAVYSVFVYGRFLRAAFMLFISATLGAVLGYFMPTFTAFAVLLALSAYDIFAVYKGPLGKLASATGIDEIPGLLLESGGVKIGLGDLVFYSMLSAHVFSYFGPIPFLSAALGIIAGGYFTLKMVEREKIFPGLPFSLVLGIALALLTNLIL